MLVGTVTIEKSEHLSAALSAANISHPELNARFHEDAAKIIALAGLPASVPIETNMAVRGTDIQLGGNLHMRVAQEDKATDGSYTPTNTAASSD